MNKYNETLIACEHCDLLQVKQPLQLGQIATCPRCGSRLYFNSICSPMSMLALTLTALILLLPANLYPLLSMTMIGSTETASLLQATLKIFHEGNYFVALLIFICSTIAPFLMLLSLCCASFIISFNIQTQWLKKLLKWTDFLTHWSMLEVYLVSFLVALIKLVDLADIELGVGLVCFSLLMIINSLILSFFDASSYWQKVPIDAIS
ncbi:MULTISPECIES: paraquat-inducible protein A [unclassified Motilimonas]|uniref:paraquat-inducible protein A n=1 Tax=Motilimonas TaxID=1914248 RepID=UPI001E330FE6|nr:MULTISPECIES: paraquat-inducible protein A [unclassified Motilimonas]MCE0556919.1 paraquat-inducible protein A [Motilimonas sp. E26]MDO6525530.1 paraquat-inducible protein A [Motilimonas sp. 1_MG-2023]